MARKKKSTELTNSQMASGLKKASVRSGRNVKGKRIAAVAEITAKNPVSIANKMRGPKGREKIDTAVRENVKRSIKGTRDARLSNVLKKRGPKMGIVAKAKTLGKLGVAKMSRFDKATGKQRLKKRYKVLGAVGAYAAYRSIKNKNKEQGR